MGRYTSKGAEIFIIDIEPHAAEKVSVGKVDLEASKAKTDHWLNGQGKK